MIKIVQISILLFVLSSSLNSCSNYKRTNFIEGKTHYKELINSKKGLTVVKYLVYSSNNELWKKGKRIEDNRGTWSEPIYFKEQTFDTISGRRIHLQLEQIFLKR